ncbi:MAG: hypothetical protein R3D98_11375 [Candidatus Krumholzibacteriia bacterium]
MTIRTKTSGLLLGLALLMAASPAAALPRYSAQYGQRCALCHVEPTGGGLRTQYASMALIPDELSFLQMEPSETAQIRPDLSPAVTVGLDLRSLVYEGERERGSQLDMQGDVYVGFQATNRFAAYVEMGKGGAHEYAGLAYVLPGGGYLKAGRFTPDYGWHWADHKLASREYLLDENGSVSPAALTEAGVEIGVHEQWWEATGSLLQGGAENGQSYAGRLVLRKSVRAVNLAMGTSILRRELASGHARAWGGFGYISAGPATWVFEVDETGNGRRTGLLISQELTYRLVRGIHARGTYSFQDPDHRAKNGTRNRWGIGVDSLLSPFFGAQVMANYDHFRQGELVTGSDSWQGELVLHFLY